MLRHEKYCEFNKHGARKMSEVRGRGRPSLAETQPQKVMGTMTDGELRKAQYEDNVKSTISCEVVTQ